MAGDRAHFPREGEVQNAIADMNEAHQAVTAWLQTMTDPELEHVRQDIRRMYGHVLEEQLRRGVAADRHG